MTADASGLTGTTPTVTTGDDRSRATGSTRRSSTPGARALNTNDLRGKVLRIKVKADGSYTIPAGQPVPGDPGRGGKTRPEIYAMGFRNPFRIKVDENDVAYVTDYSPDSQVPEHVPRPGRHRAAWRSSASRPTTAGRCCYRRPAVLPVELQHVDAAGRPAAAVRVRQPDARARRTPRAGTRRPDRRAGSRRRRSRNPDIWYSFQDNHARPARHAVLRVLQHGRGRRPCPQLFPELGTGGVGPHGAAKYDYDPANPSPTKFPPYYDGAIFFGEFTRDYLREIRLDSTGQGLQDQRRCSTAARRRRRRRPFECDNPMDMQFGRRRQLLPADVRRRLLRRQPGRRHVQVGVRQGPAGADGRAAAATPTDGPAPLTVQLLQRGLARPGSGRLDHASRGTSTATARSTRSTRTRRFTYTTNGVYTARLTVTDSSGKTDSQDDDDHRRQHRADGDDHHAGRRWLLRLRGEHPVHGHGHRPGGRPDRLRRGRGHVRPRATTRTATPRRRRPAAPACCTPTPRTRRHGGNVFGGISASYTDPAAQRPAGADDGRPEHDPAEAPGGRVRRQDQSGHEHGRPPTTSAAACTAAASSNGDWIALNARSTSPTWTSRSRSGSPAAAAGAPRHAAGGGRDPPRRRRRPAR